MNVGRAIRLLRETNEIRLGDLAKKAELSVSMLSMIESGKREPSLGALRRLATSLSIPLDVLLAVTQPGEGTLTSSDERATGFVAVLQRVEKIEEEIRLMTIKQVSL